MRVPFLLAATLLVGATAVPVTDDNAAVRDAARAYEEAQLHRDRAALERMLAPDFLLVRGSGRIGDRRDVIDGYTDPAGRIDAMEIVDRLFLRPAPDLAIVGGEARVRGMEDGKAFADHFRYADTFVRRDGRWLVVYTQVTPLDR